jgi:hypothetical protein
LLGRSPMTVRMSPVRSNRTEEGGGAT